MILGNSNDVYKSINEKRGNLVPFFSTLDSIHTIAWVLRPKRHQRLWLGVYSKNLKNQEKVLEGKFEPNSVNLFLTIKIQRIGSWRTFLEKYLLFREKWVYWCWKSLWCSHRLGLVWSGIKLFLFKRKKFLKSKSP